MSSIQDSCKKNYDGKKLRPKKIKIEKTKIETKTELRNLLFKQNTSVNSLKCFVK